MGGEVDAGSRGWKCMAGGGGEKKVLMGRRRMERQRGVKWSCAEEGGRVGVQEVRKAAAAAASERGGWKDGLTD